MRLIDADELVCALQQSLENTRDECVAFAVGYAKSFINGASTYVNISYGFWDDRFETQRPYCSRCHTMHTCRVRYPNFCPNCGSKMSGGIKSGKVD